MPGKRPKPEEIVSKLRQVEVLQSQGKTAAEAIRSIAAGPNVSNGISQDGVDFFNATVMSPIGDWLKQIVLAARRHLPAAGRI